MQLNIQGVSYGLQWGTGAFILAEKRLGASLEEIIFKVSGDTETVMTLTYCALQNWYQLQDETKTLPITYNQFVAWIDDQPQELAKQIYSSFMESNMQGESMKNRYNRINAMITASSEGGSAPLKKKRSPSIKS